MISNSLKIALRNFYKKPAFSIINVLGLAIGLACFVLTIVYVNYELSYDSVHEKRDRTYLATVTINFADYFIENQESTTATFVEAVKSSYPEVEDATQTIFGISQYVRIGDTYFNERSIAAADSSFFKVFTHEFIAGDPRKALIEPFSVVLTESTAKKYFGEKDAFGETLNLMDENFKVTGIIKDLPENVSFGFKMIFSIYIWDGWYNDPEWQNNNFYNFLVLKEGANPIELEHKFPDLLKSKIQTIRGKDFESWLADGNRWEYHLFSMSDVYLKLWGNGIYLIGFGIVAIFLLIIACINYMNLSTAKAAQRAKEVGIRKVVGAYRSNLISQFTRESMFMSFLALIIGMGIVEALLPFLSLFIDAKLSIHYFDNFVVLPALLALGIIVGFISGLYPAFVLSSYIPVKVLKGNINKKGKGLNLRNALVLIQFTMSIALIISLIVVVKQTDLLYTKKLGYNKDNLMVVTMAASIKNPDLFKAELSKIPTIESASFTSRMPSRGAGNSQQWTPEGKETTLLTVHVTDEDFLKTMKIGLHAGRYFSKEFLTDSSAVVINRKAAEFLNWGDTLNRKLNAGNRDYHVIGIIEDYHFQTLQEEINPLIICMAGGHFRMRPQNLAIRIKAGAEPPITEIEKAWNNNTWERNTPFEYYFFAERYKTYYKQEGQTRQLMSILTVLILLVTALGLYGLASYATQERMKEIAIRKAMGASINLIVAKMTWSFTKLVLFANVVAWPLAWYFMNDWLSGFATRINISWWIFVLAALLSYFLAIATIIFQAYSAARRNPIEVLRYE
ncbi:MAG: ABC transporter permease [Bacteroidetes bacterium]|nr:ABC transporter permease [Bacteroidota bacterium]